MNFLKFQGGFNALASIVQSSAYLHVRDQATRLPRLVDLS